jgi:signal transduction histidine kinase
MRSATRESIRLWPLALVTLGVLGLVSVARALGFGDGVVLGATPASGAALAAGLVLRWRGALAAAVGFGLAGLVWGLGSGAAMTDSGAHGLAALLGAQSMRMLARRRTSETKTYEWLVFLAGVSVFTATVAGVFAAAAVAGFLVAQPFPWTPPLLAAIFEPLGVMTFCALLLSLRELRAVLADPRPALGIFAVALVLLGILALLLASPIEQVDRSGITLLLSVPFCLWVAMQRRSLDGAGLSFLAAHAALLMMLRESGSIHHVDFVTTIVYLDLLVATCQLVHAVNLDRVRAVAANEAHKRELEARVAERTARLTAMTERALAADAAKSKFVATVSHEVRTPLNGVIGMASLVLAGDLDARTRRNVEVIRNSGLHMLDVVNRILEFTRLGREPTPPETAAFDLRELVAEVLAEARAAPHAGGLRLVADIEPRLPTRRVGYRQGVRQVLTNLVGNALKFTDRGSITVRVRAARDHAVRFEVEDTGIGIPPEMQERIFRPFEQVAGSQSRRPGGTGLGLAICAETVERMGGRIGLNSEPNTGSVFWVELPLPNEDARKRLGLHVAASA